MEVTPQTLDINTKGMGFYTRNSFLIHTLFIIACIYSGYYFNEVLEDRKKLNIKLIESSVRVDIVAMPKMTVKELKALEKLAAGQKEVEEVVPPEPKKEIKPLVEAKGPELLKKAKKLSFAEMMKQYSKKKLPKAKPKKSKSKRKTKSSSKVGNGGLSQSDRMALANLVKEGNQLKMGTALTGDANTAVGQGAFVEYIGQVREWVKPNWKLPSYLMDQELNCRIRVFIGPNGKLLQAEIFESSGNDEYDAKALSAVKASHPFPSSSNDIRSRVVGGDIVLGFPL